MDFCLNTFVVSFIIVGLITEIKATVTLTYSTDYSHLQDSGYYVLHDQNISFICAFDVSPLEVTWTVNGVVIYTFSFDSHAASNSKYNSRILDYQSTDLEHQLVLRVSKNEDEGKFLRCTVSFSGTGFEEGVLLLQQIMVPPSTVTLQDLGVIINETQTNVQCVVSSVYKGEEVTEFKLNIGDSYLSNGIESQNGGLVNGTQTVTYTQPATFSYTSQQGQQVQCEVIWMKNTIVATTKISTSQTLDIYFPLQSNTLNAKASDSVNKGSDKVLRCTTGSANPVVSSMLWKKGGTEVTSGVTSQILNGEYGAEVLESSYTFTAKESDNEQSVSCSPVWNGQEVTDLKKQVQLDVIYSPSSVTLNPMTETLEGDSIKITCTSSASNPEPVLTLYQSGVKLVEYATGYSVTHTLVAQREINGDSVQCIATSTNTEKLIYVTNSTEVILKVKFPLQSNTLNAKASDSVNKGSDKVLRCTTGSANPVVSSMLWKKGGTEVTSGVTSQILNGEYGAEVLESSYTFTANESDNGQSVSCSPVWNGQEVTNLKKQVQLDVTYSPSSVTLTPLTKTLEGDSIKITCTSSASNPEPVLTLYQSGVKLVESATGYSVTHTLVAQREINGDSVQCIATSTNTEKLIYVTISPEVLLKVKFPLQSNHFNSEAYVSVKAGKQKVLRCTTGSSNPVVSFMMWSKGGSEVTSGVTSHTLNGDHGGEVFESIYSFIAQKSDNGHKVSCTPVWDEIEVTQYKEDINLNVTFPPVVTVEGASSTIDEGSLTAIDCNIINGNPQTLTTLYWEFEPKYPDSQSQALPNQETNRELRIESTAYTDAGSYRCTAGNTVGNDTEQIQIVVQYSPQLYTTDTLVFYSGLNEKVTLSLRVRAFPEFTELESAFIWTKPVSANTNDAVVISSRLRDELFESLLIIDSVMPIDYGKYTVSAANKVNRTVFTLELQQNGPPQAPRDVSVEARAAEAATISWVVGLNGGSSQTFKILLINTTSNEDITIYTDFNNPHTGLYLEANITNLKAETEYNFYIISINLYNGSSETKSKEVMLVTRAKPNIKQERLLIEIDGSTATLTWEYTVLESDSTLVFIEQCTSPEDCTEHNVTDNMDHTLEVTVSDGDDFYLVIYLDGLQAYRSEEFVLIMETTSGTVGGSPTAAIIGALLAVIAVAAVLVILGVMYRRHKIKTKSESPEDLDNYLNEGKNSRKPNSTDLESIILTEHEQHKDTKPEVTWINPLSSQQVTSDEKGSTKPVVEPGPEEILYENAGELHQIRSETLVPKSDMLAHYSMMASKNLFETEFKKLSADPVHPCTYGGVEELRDKNRFKNMLPYDNNRVHLQDIDGVPLSDYINASFIKGYSGNISYIATIGCTKESINDIWRMVWEQKLSVIVMVTNLIEKNKRKCEKYWPTGEPICFGEITVKPGTITTYAEYEIKHFVMEKDGESRTLVHYHYIGWPDHGVPLTAATILKIREQIKQHRIQGQEPILVHCSAGVGRTGTFIAIDYLLDQVELDETVDVLECVKGFREQRVNMIQTKDQYRFVYEVLTEAVCIGKNTSIACGDLSKSLEMLKASGTLETQFQFLQVTKPTFNTKATALANLFGNKKKNKDPNIVPADQHRVILKASPKDYINAVYVDGYKTEKGFIATQTPVSNTIASFWTMVLDEKSQTIVCVENNKSDLEWYPKEEVSRQYESFMVTNTGTMTVEGIRVSGITVQIQGDGTYANVGLQGKALEEEHSLMVFDISEWSETPMKERDMSTLHKLYADVQEWQQKCDNTRVMSMCYNGANECGVYIASSYLFDMANAEQEVDIFHSLKQIRQTRPQFITSLDQYIFLHEVVQEYISQFETYANFS